MDKSWKKRSRGVNSPNQNQQNTDIISNLYDRVIRCEKEIKEVIWGQIFEMTIKDSQWLSDKSFSPGRWAMGFESLYVLYRIIDESKPRKILELGLGQSTKMINQYVNNMAYPVTHKVIEHDEKWFGFYRKNNSLNNTDIILLDLSEEGSNGDKLVKYKGFEAALRNDKYDLIVIDGPYGGSKNKLSRVDILDILPSCLEKSFIIIFDDANRIGEKESIKLILKKLDEQKIEYCHGKYESITDCFLIMSTDNEFYKTL